jgi:hypothetical protein
MTILLVRVIDEDLLRLGACDRALAAGLGVAKAGAFLDRGATSALECLAVLLEPGGRVADRGIEIEPGGRAS